jgi:hypothetical protein
MTKRTALLFVTALAIPALASAQGTRGFEGGGVSSAMSYAPLGVEKSPAAGGMMTAGAVATRLSANTQHVSPVTGQAIMPSALGAVAQVISGGTGARESANSLVNALSGGGRQSAAAALVAALGALGGSNMGNERAAVGSAIQAFNDFTRTAPDSFFANVPQEYLAIHVALGMLAK